MPDFVVDSSEPTREWCECEHDDLGAWTIIVDSHFLFAQHCFFLPGPPNFGLSAQLGHWPQSSAKHPSHSPHLDLFLPV